MARPKGFTHEHPVGGPVDWYTPPEVFEKIGLKYDMDVAYPEDKVLDWIPAAHKLTVKHDGLNRQWYGRIWMNPPYDGQIHIWLDKLSKHGNGIALVWARTDLVWFQDYAAKADYVLFTRSRICFINQDMKRMARPASGSVFLAFGKDNAKALKKSGLGIGFYNGGNV